MCVDTADCLDLLVVLLLQILERREDGSMQVGVYERIWSKGARQLRESRFGSCFVLLDSSGNAWQHLQVAIYACGTLYS